MSDALDLGSVEVAMRIARVPDGERLETASRLIVLHAAVREIQRAKERSAGG